jgi:hypothetical protein
VERNEEREKAGVINGGKREPLAGQRARDKDVLPETRRTRAYQERRLPSKKVSQVAEEDSGRRFPLHAVFAERCQIFQEALKALHRKAVGSATLAVFILGRLRSRAAWSRSRSTNVLSLLPLASSVTAA